MSMIDSVLKQFVPRSWGFFENGGVGGVGGGGGGLMLGIGLGSSGASGMTAGGLSSPPVDGVVGGLEGLSLVCESPRTHRRNPGSTGSGSSGGGGSLMWSAEGGRQLETWRVRLR